MSPFRLAFLSLTRRKISSFVALLSIVVSVATSGILYRLYLLTNERFSTLANGVDAIVGAKSGGIDILLGALNLEGDYPGFLPQKLFESLEAQQTVKFEDGATSEPNYLKSVVPFLYFAKLENYRVIGTNEKFFAENMKFASGSSWNSPTSLVAGAGLAEKLGLHVGSKVKILIWTNKGSSQPLSFEICGMLAPTGSAWDYGAYVDYKFAQSVLSQVDLGSSTIWQNQVLNYFLVRIDPQGRNQLESLINKRTVGQVAWVADEKAHLEKLTGTGREIGFLISALVLLLGGLSVTAMMTARFEAMNVQIAVVRAIGFTRSEISSWLFSEGLLVGVTATFFGALIDFVGFPFIKNLLGDSIPNIEWLNSSIFQSWPIWIVAILATLIALVLPAIRIVNQDIHDQLKSL